MDVAQLKEYIYDNNYVENILKDIGCHHIKYHSSGYWSCANKDGDNESAVITYNNENLNCTNYTRKMTAKERQTDLIDLVCFTKSLSFPDGLKYLANLIGIDYYHDFNEQLPESLQITQLIHDMKEHIETEEDKPVKPISKRILSYYKDYVNDLFYEDHITYLTQKEFNIGYDEDTNRITIPIFSEIGDLVGVKGRLFKKKLDKHDLKYLYIEPCARQRILYGLNKTLPYIERAGRVYVAEAEKAVMQLWSYGYQNVVATGGKQVSRQQIDMLTRLGVEVVFIFDKDVELEEIQNLGDRFIDGVPISYIMDNSKEGILDEKESPTDDPKKWELLLNNYLYTLK